MKKWAESKGSHKVNKGPKKKKRKARKKKGKEKGYLGLYCDPTGEEIDTPDGTRRADLCEKEKLG